MSARTWAKLTISGVVLHAAAFGLLHILEPQLRLSSSIISDYSQTGSSWLSTTAFLVFALIWASLAVALSVEALGQPFIQAGRVLFGLAVIGIAVGAVAPATADPRTGSVIARVQNLVARPGLFLGVLLVSVGLLRSSGWSRIARALTVLAVVGTVTLVLTVALLLEAGFGGFGQRFLFLVLYAWITVLALGLSREADEGVDAIGRAKGAL